jgi:hypothetical protein
MKLRGELQILAPYVPYAQISCHRMRVRRSGEEGQAKLDGGRTDIALRRGLVFATATQPAKKDRGKTQPPHVYDLS